MTKALIQARMTSARFHGKVLKKILERPMLELMVERVRKSQMIDDVIVITSTDLSDDPIELFCLEKNICYFRGDLNDVLNRYYQAAKKFKVKNIVRLTGDCPLIDPWLIDETVKFFIENKLDFAGNSTPPESTVPDGMDVEIFSFESLQRASKEAYTTSDREHVTFYFWKNPDKFRVGIYKLENNLSHYRLSVDYPEDFELVTKIFEFFNNNNNNIPATLEKIIKFLEDNPGYAQINSHIKTNCGWNLASEDVSVNRKE
ncbi:MAG: glycosyltransferase family protein [Oligoflexia bacterium]|nr:glycosyltransferase family protein [Oligoflexia bacterium]